jgi:hypothetical protein
MARKVMNRKELRRQADAAEDREEEEVEDEVEDSEDADDDESGDDDDDDEPKAKAKKKAPAKKKARTKAVKEVRLKAFWGVFNQSMKRVALFEYSEKKAAQKKADELTTSQKTPHFIQPVKEVIS